MGSTIFLNYLTMHHPMEETIEFCTSCGRGLGEGSVVFACPNCGAPIARCNRCREQSIPYKCPNCGFEGP